MPDMATQGYGACSKTPAYSIMVDASNIAYCHLNR